jgi:formylglycine-generating enzyme required for sulfatase activity/class 3 adenylate cyclase
MQVVFVDIVAYSRRKSHAQVKVINAFRDCFEAALATTEQQFRDFWQSSHLALRENVILLPIGDGAAVAFPFAELHDAHLVFATSLLKAIRARSLAADCTRFGRQGWCDCHDAMKVRIGVSEGKLIVYKDLNDNFNVAGTTVNLASRVMGVADVNQILFSEDAYRQITEMISGAEQRFVAYKGVVVKHGLTLTVYQYIDKTLKGLNSGRNQKLEAFAIPQPPRSPGDATTPAAPPAHAPVLAPARRKVSSETPRRAPARSPTDPFCSAILSRFIEVPAGTFKMGNDLTAQDTVIMPRTFLVDRYPVTQDVYVQVMGHHDSQFVGDRLPVDTITWLEAIEFCNALSRRCARVDVYRITGKTVSINYDANGFRLPTEAEWEYACGNAGISANEGLDAVAWFATNTTQTQNVGQLKPNALGLHDMLGNVWEWCNDWFEQRSGSHTLTAPTGPADGFERVVRGGSWSDFAATVSPTYRSRRVPSSRTSNVGFRLVTSQ